jgi:tight adherence protein C
VIETLIQPPVIFSGLVAVAVFATLFTMLTPLLARNELKSRMKTVALEREEMRARERARLAADSDRRRKTGGSLRHEQRTSIREFVERLDLKRALADEKTLAKLKTAGFRGQNPLNVFLFMRFVLPFAGLVAAAAYIFVLGALPKEPMLIKLFICILGGYAGFYAPNIYVSNRASKRKQSITLAWPDALDLTLICVESGMSAEAAFRKVAEEIGTQSVELAEELALTTAELSYLQERRQAYDNLANRTGLEAVKAMTQALTQAERYGTPIGQALRVLSQESRDHRLNEAEKKAAALPPKLTVPMILFFLPVLFGVILGPAAIKVLAHGAIFPQH